MNIENIKQQIITFNLAHQDELIGCTKQEVKEIETRINHPLPVNYKHFLLALGKSAGQFLKGSDCFYPTILYLNEDAREILEANNFPQALPEDAFVFFMHQGYQFSFFPLNEGDNPLIYYFNEGEQQLSFTQSHEHFTDLLTTEIELHQKYLMSPLTL